MSSPGWVAYLDQFHAQRPGVTERVLRHAHADDGDAYDWLAAAVPADGLVVDVACGNAPLWTRLPGRSYFGVDRSAAELRAAIRRGVHTLVLGDAAALPLPDASTVVATCSMGLQILTPLHQILAEISRVLRPGGRLAATVPASRPLRPFDVPVIAGLLATLGRRLSYPNDAQLRHAGRLLATHDLRVVADETRRYPYRLNRIDDAERFLASLYLPGVAAWRQRAARAYLRALARAHVTLPVPIRRIIAVRA